MSTGLNEQKDFYDNYWRDMKPIGSYKLMRTQWIANMLQQLSRQNSQKQLQLLDLGCGDGRLTPFWQSVTGAATYALELSPMAVREAQRLFPSVTYTQGDATHTPYGNQMFDIIVCQEVLEHIEQQELLVNEAARILKPGGQLILTTPNKFYFDRRKGGNYSQQPIEHILDKEELYRLLDTQFIITHFETLIYAKGDYGVYKLLTNKYLLAMLRRFGTENSWKRRLLKHGYGLHLAVLCTKK